MTKEVEGSEGRLRYGIRDSKKDFWAVRFGSIRWTERKSKTHFKMSTLCHSHIGPVNAIFSFSSSSTTISDLKCFYTNATSLENKWTDFKARIATLDHPHIIAITKIWFNSSSLTSINNYTEYLQSREGRGGGVAICIKNDIHSLNCEFNDQQLVEYIFLYVIHIMSIEL